MQANLYATFRLLAGVKTIELPLKEGATVYQAVCAVIERCPVLRAHWLDEQGELHAHVHVFVNGDEAQNLPQGLLTPLDAGAVLDFFPPVGGG